MGSFLVFATMQSNVVTFRSKERDNMKKKYRYTITWQFALIFAGLLVAAFALFILVNSTFLEDFYIRNKEEKLYSAFAKIEEAAEKDRMQTEAFAKEIENICRVDNMDLIIADVDSKTVMYVGKEQESLRLALWDKIFLENESAGEIIIEQGDKYRLLISTDSRTGVEYIEIWGFLKNDNLFLMRTALQSVVEAASITNRFITIIGIIILAISVIIIVPVTRKVSKPILTLAEISEQVGNLNFDVKYEGKHRNELGILGDNINKMSRALEQTISELKTANAELKRDIEKKEHIEEMRSEFISNVSHELKTPLAIIQGYAEGLEEGISEDKESRDYYCSVICDEVSKMNTMVKQLLTLNELEFGKDNVEMERFDVVTMIGNRLQAADIMIKSSNIEVNFSEENPIYVWGDEFRVEEVFTNLLSNAINHCENEKRIDITVTQDEKNIRVNVYNTGEHIPENSREHLFEKFYKVDKARTRAYGGSGIGLSIVKAIQDSMGQNYGMDNAEDGVNFWFEIERA